MKFRRPRSLNGLILVGFALVVTPLLVAVLWALFNLDRLAKQSEQLVITGVSAAENNRLITEQIGSLARFCSCRFSASSSPMLNARSTKSRSVSVSTGFW